TRSSRRRAGHERELTGMLRTLSCTLLVATLACACKGVPSPNVDVGFIADDFDRALERARSTHRPLFVDVWTTWCQPCMMMKPAFADPVGTQHRDDFVWLSIDADRSSNRPFLERFPVHGLPTLWVIDPATGRVVLKWERGATAETLGALLVASTEVWKNG